MLLQRLDLSSESNMSSSENDTDSKKYFIGSDLNRNTDYSISPLFSGSGPFSNNNNQNATENRTIPALPTLTAPPSSTSWSSSSGLHPLFNSSTSLVDNNNLQSNSNPLYLNPHLNPKPQSYNRPTQNALSNKSFHGGAQHTSVDMSNAPLGSIHRSSDPLEAVLGPFPCVRIRGLPLDASLEDVLFIFQGLVVLDVVVLPHSYSTHGNGGEAFVVFGNPIDFQMALERNRLTLGHQLVEVYQGKRTDYYAAVLSSMQLYNTHRVDETGTTGEGNQGNNMPGSHWSASGVHHTITTQGRRTPLMQEVNSNAGNLTGGPYPHHSSYSKGPMSASGGRGRGSGESNRAKGSGRGNGRGGGIQVGEHTGFLRMRGLPFTVTKGEIYEFFQKYEPIEESICLTYRTDGRATGEGYIAFTKPDDAKDAMALHRNTMGSRYIELFISNKEEHGRALSREASFEN